MAQTIWYPRLVIPTEYVLGKASTARSASGSGGAGSNRRVS
ncbi:hypothetical protein [Synechococcus sp. CC9902]|nr:hypothetical protein [Synechococcus sp. CC9902]